jgi:hypothetical protein
VKRFGPFAGILTSEICNGVYLRDLRDLVKHFSKIPRKQFVDAAVRGGLLGSKYTRLAATLA